MDLVFKHLDAIPNTIQIPPPFQNSGNLLHQIPIQKPKTKEKTISLTVLLHEPKSAQIVIPRVKWWREVFKKRVSSFETLFFSLLFSPPSAFT